jgi:hypothetical protein
MPTILEHQSNVLQEACTWTTGYSSENTRSQILAAFKTTFNGLEPYSWQINKDFACAECMDVAFHFQMAQVMQMHGLACFFEGFMTR